MTYYSFLLGIGAVTGLLRLARVAPRASRNSWLLVGLLVDAGALIGARLGFVFEHFDFFRQHLDQALAFWSGGFTWQAGVLGALSVLLILSRVLRTSWQVMLDLTAMMLLPVAVTLWLGAWTEGAAYGAAAPEGAWYAFPAADVFGITAMRVPVQLMASLTLLLVIGIVESVTTGIRRKGIRGSLIWVTFSLIMVGFTLLRDDPAPMLLGLRMETWFAILFSGIFIFLTLGLYFASDSLKTESLPEPLEELKDEQA